MIVQPCLGLQRFLRLMYFLACLAALAPASALADAQSAAPDQAIPVDLHFFWSAGCPHCLAAHPFVTAIPQQRPWVRLHTYEISKNPQHVRKLVELARESGQTAEGVPALLFCGALLSGWESAATTGQQLLRALDACHTRNAKPAVTIAQTDRVDVPWLGAIDLAATDPAAVSAHLPLLTLVLAGLDAFNPCAFFVLLFLLSLLTREQDRHRMLMISSVFILTSGLMYFAFMAAWLNVFEVLGMLPWITLAAGVLAIVGGALNIKDFFAFGKGISLSIPEAAKPGIYRRMRAILHAQRLPATLAATIILALGANFYELLCTAGFPMLYTRLLTLSAAPSATRYAWLALYNLIYILPLALIVLISLTTLSAHKLTAREGRLLKLMSGIMMFELGLTLAFAPQWLNTLTATAALLGLALAILALAAWLTRSGKSPH